MSVQRSPPSSKCLTPNEQIAHCASDSELIKSNNFEKPESLNVTKRQKRSFKEYSDGSANALSEIKKMFVDLKTQQDSKFDAFNNSLSTMVEQNSEIRKCLDFMSKQYDDIIQKVSSLEQENKDYKKQVQLLENKLDMYEKNARNSCIELRNIPKQENETKNTLIQIAMNVGKALSITPDLQVYDINDVYRMKSGKIVVDFTSTLRKEIYIKKYKEFNKLKKDSKLPLLNSTDLTLSGAPMPIYMSEYLSKKAGKLFFQARELVRKKILVAAWTSHGRIYVKKVEGQTSIRVYDDKDLSKFS